MCLRLFVGLIGAAVFTAAGVAEPSGPRVADRVVLLHGLGRGPGSLRLLAATLREEGFCVSNVSYPSRRGSIDELADQALGPNLRASEGRQVHVVTHSLGGILLRSYLQKHGVPPDLGRVVMLAPPNSGSELADALAGWRLYRWVNGPAGLALGTGPEQAPAVLGPLPAGLEVGVVAGEFSWNPVFSAFIPGADDGKVAVARTHVAGETDHLTLPYSHTWLMNRAETRRQVLAFLRTGRFAPGPPETGSEAQKSRTGKGAAESDAKRRRLSSRWR